MTVFTFSNAINDLTRYAYIRFHSDVLTRFSPAEEEGFWEEMETKTNTERRSAVITSDNSNLSIGAVM